MIVETLLCTTDYSGGQKEAAHRVLIELSNLFHQYKDDICIVGGGGVPDLMFPNAGHIGSVDVDVLVNQLTLKDEGYQNMSKILNRNGYKKHEEKYFTYIKTIEVDGIDYDIDVDILAGMYGGNTTTKSQHIQGLKALKATGGNLAFEIRRQSVDIEAKRPDGSIDCASISVVAVVPYFIMKTVAMGRGKPKDAYDLYFLLQNYTGGIPAIVQEFIPYLDKQIVISMKDKLHKKFKTEEHSGVVDILKFIDSEFYEDRELLRRDVFERFSTFLNLLDEKGNKKD